MLGTKPCQTKPSTSGSVEPGLVAVGVEQAQLDPLGDLAEQREVGARAVVGGPQRIGLARRQTSELGLATCGVAASMAQGAPLTHRTDQDDDTARRCGSIEGEPLAMEVSACQPMARTARLPHLLTGHRRWCGNHHAQPACSSATRSATGCARSSPTPTAARPRRRGAGHRADRHAARVLRGRRPECGRADLRRPGSGFSAAGVDVPAWTL